MQLQTLPRLVMWSSHLSYGRSLWSIVGSICANLRALNGLFNCQITIVAARINNRSSVVLLTVTLFTRNTDRRKILFTIVVEESTADGIEPEDQKSNVLVNSCQNASRLGKPRETEHTQNRLALEASSCKNPPSRDAGLTRLDKSSLAFTTRGCPKERS